jgi:putative nucleotidyltransferase with HDIG domain
MKCPGQDTRYWNPGAVFEVPCPACGSEVEFFKDDTARRCGKCGHRFVNPQMDFGCASYCPYAEQCLGDLPPELLARKEDLLKDRVAIEMKRYFGKDFRRIAHAANVARYAEKMVALEKGNPAVVLCSAFLHDIGIQEAEKRDGGSGARHHEKEGVPIAREILTRLGAGEALIEEVCDIIGHHHGPGDDETVNFRIVYDADFIVNLETRYRNGEINRERIEEIVEKTALTETGKRLARETFLGEEL